ncbi:MAG: prevent-host-death protein [Comamonadaceae bacterium]|nr:MAG: prevent-host-death protein [Comamonadaceae bacterium]
MVAVLPLPEHLPTRTASQVKNQWGDVVRQVRKSGTVAVTHYATVEMVLIDTATYRRLAEDMQALNAKEQSSLDELNLAFKDRLALLQNSEAGERVGELMAARGKSTQRPEAGASF